MPFTWSESGGELELEITAPDERSVFLEGFEAMRELLGGGAGAGAARRVALAGTDRAALLADFLAELAIIADAEGLVPTRVSDLTLDGAGLTARVEAAAGAPRTIVTGATYARLAFEQRDDGWFARAGLGLSRE